MDNDTNAFHGELAITNPVWAQLDMDSFQLLPGVHIPKQFAARLPQGAIPASTSTSTAAPGSPPRNTAVRMCRDDPNCTRDDCYFTHTNKAPLIGKCAYGERCTKNGCTLSHEPSDSISPPLKATTPTSTLSANAPIFELDETPVEEPFVSYGGRLPRGSKHAASYDETSTTSGTGAGINSNGWWSQSSRPRRTSPPSTPSRSPTRSTSPPNGLATIPRPVNMTPMRRVNHNINSTAPTQSGRADTANAWTSVRRHHRHNSNGYGSSPSRSRGHWHQSHSNSMVSVSA
jgi:hypothetical protein